MTVHTYPLNAVIGDYLRAGAGIVIAIIPLVFVPPKPLVVAIFSIAICIFIGYGIRTVLRHRSRIEVDEEKIAVNAAKRREIPWCDLNGLRLKYFTTRSKWSMTKGWFQLVLQGGGQTIAVESSLEGFAEIAERAGHAAGQNGIALDEASAANMASLKLPPGDAAP
jgi:hypothetical protein